MTMEDESEKQRTYIEWCITVVHHKDKEVYEPDLDEIQLCLALMFLSLMLFLLVVFANPGWF